MGALVGLDGKQIEGELPSDEPLAILKMLVAKIESGMLTLSAVYVLGEIPKPGNESMVSRESWDSGLTVAQAVFRLEMEKNMVINAVLADQN